MAKVQVVETVELPKIMCIKCGSDEFYRDVLYYDENQNKLVNGVMCRDCFKKLEEFKINNTD